MSGRNRLPPAVRASAATSDANRTALDGLSEASLEIGHVRREPRCRLNGGERVHAAAVPVCNATIEPARSRKRTFSKPARSSSSASSSGGRKPPHGRRQVAVGAAARKQSPGERHDPFEPNREERTQRSARARDLEHGNSPARPHDAAELTQSALELCKVAHAEAHSRGVEALVRKRQSEQVGLDPLDLSRLAAGAFEHPRSEVDADDLARAGAEVGKREIARAAGGIEHPVTGPDNRRCGKPAPAHVEASRHQPVHRVVDRRDPVEHRPHGVGSKPSGLDGHCPHRLLERVRAPAGRGSARRRSRRDPAPTRRRGRSPAPRRGSSRGLAELEQVLEVDRRERRLARHEDELALLLQRDGRGAMDQVRHRARGDRPDRGHRARADDVAVDLRRAARVGARCSRLCRRSSRRRPRSATAPRPDRSVGSP